MLNVGSKRDTVVPNVALETYRAAVQRWPNVKIRLGNRARVIEQSWGGVNRAVAPPIGAAVVVRRSLQEHGWSENKNIAIHSYHPEGQLDRVRAFAAELAHANMDVIVTAGGDAVHAAQQATHTIPIVMASVGDAVRAGIVASLARPGGNVTGMTLVATEMGTKRLELLKEVVPKSCAGGRNLERRKRGPQIASGCS